MQSNIKICLFIHFSTSKNIPYNVKIYVKELSKYFDEVRFLTNYEDNNCEIEFFKGNIIHVFDTNEGSDFGRIYNYLKRINIEDYKEIACVNDSNVLLGPLDKVMEWGRTSQLDFWGIIDSHEKPRFSTHKNNYHIQSHFMVFNCNAISHLQEYFDSIDFKFIFRIKDKKDLRNRVINDWEIGLSQFLIRKDLKIGAFKECTYFTPKKSSKKPINVTHKLYYDLICDDYPLLKKKVAIDGKWLDWILGKKYWKYLIRQHSYSNFDSETIVRELLEARNKI